MKHEEQCRIHKKYSFPFCVANLDRLSQITSTQVAISSRQSYMAMQHSKQGPMIFARRKRVDEEASLANQKLMWCHRTVVMAMVMQASATYGDRRSPMVESP